MVVEDAQTKILLIVFIMLMLIDRIQIISEDMVVKPLALVLIRLLFISLQLLVSVVLMVLKP